MCLATVAGCCTKKAVGYAIGATMRGTGPGLRGDRYGVPQYPTGRERTILAPSGRGTVEHELTSSSKVA